MIRFSVIIPAFNAAGTIAETVESVLAQTYPHWEIIVVNDGSTDKTEEVANRYARMDGRIHVVTQRNLGEAAARNSGITETSHDWLVFLDSDDWIAADYLFQMADAIRTQPDVVAVHCGYARVAMDGTKVVENYQPPTGNLFDVLACRPAFPVNACVVRKTVVTESGAFDPSFKTCPDWDLWQRIARTGATFGAARKVLAFYRMRPDSASLNAIQLLKDGFRIIETGHSNDSRVANPHPKYASGITKAGIENQKIYFLCWCAGLLIGADKDPRPLFEVAMPSQVNGHLYPNAIARIIFDSVPLISCQPPRKWETLFLDVQPRCDQFLDDLEKHLSQPDFADQTMFEIKKLVLSHSATWQPIVQELQEAIHQTEKRNLEWQNLTESLKQQLTEQQTEMKKLQDRAEQSENKTKELQDRVEQSENKTKELQELVEHRTKEIQELETLAERRRLESDEWQATALRNKGLYRQLRTKFWVRLGKKLRILKI